MSLDRGEDKDIIYGAEGIASSGIAEKVSGEVDDVTKKIRCYWTRVIKEYKFRWELLIDIVRGAFEKVRRLTRGGWGC